MDENRLSRRAALTGIALAGTAGLVPVTAATLGGPSEDPEFAEKVSAYFAAKAQGDRFYNRYCKPACDAYETAKANWEKACATISHATTEAAYESVGEDMNGGTWRHMTTASPIDLAVARSFTSGKPGSSDDFMTACRELISLEARREAERQRLRKEHGLDRLARRSSELGARSDELTDASYHALCSLMAHPAASISVLATKAKLIEDGDAEPDVYWEEIAADIQRLSEREG